MKLGAKGCKVGTRAVFHPSRRSCVSSNMVQLLLDSRVKSGQSRGSMLDTLVLKGLVVQ